MLTRLHIRDLAVLHETELELSSGFSVLTGETGAGKSMLVDALALALGERADSSVVRSGALRAEVMAVFDLQSRPTIAAWLEERDLDAGGECQLRRVVTPEGRSRGYINGRPVTLDALRDLGEQLVDICGQHAHQSLLRPAMQRQTLDAFGGHHDLVAAVGAGYAEWSALLAERERLLQAGAQRASREELLRFQIGELDALSPAEGEFETLQQERLLHGNLGRITAGLATVLDATYDSDETSAHDRIGAARRELEALLPLDPQLGSAAAALEIAQINVAEAADAIRRRLSALEHDPARQEFVESRLASVESLSRRHRVEPERLWTLLPRLRAELATLAETDNRLRDSDSECTRLHERLQRAATELSTARARAATALEQVVTGALRELGMPDAQFMIRMAPTPHGHIGADGLEQVEFLVSTNAGLPPGPLAKVASGGELSRLGLAIEVACMADRGTPTLVFDEVDAGIGGGVAEIVGQKLRRLSRQRQVLCVTHLAQVASQAECHYSVTKASTGEAASAAVRELTAAERVEEIARMLGGVRITERTRAHAREMLQQSRHARRAG